VGFVVNDDGLGVGDNKTVNNAMYPFVCLLKIDRDLTKGLLVLIGRKIFWKLFNGLFCL